MLRYELLAGAQVTTLGCVPTSVDVPPNKQVCDFSLGVAHAYARDAIPGWRLLEVLLPYPPPEEIDGYARFFGRSPRFGGGALALCFPSELLGRPLRRVDAKLASLLEQVVAGSLAKLPQAPGFAARVRHELSRALQDGQATLAQIATRMGITPRTLQRRLADEATTFQIMLDDCRRDLALPLLAGAELTLQEVAFALGFSEPSAFHRAFRPWTGTTPGEYRGRSKSGDGEWIQLSGPGIHRAKPALPNRRTSMHRRPRRLITGPGRRALGVCLSVGLSMGFGASWSGASAAQPDGPARASGSPAAAVAASNEFGFALYARLKADQGPGNLICSPISASIALTMAWAGARGRPGGRWPAPWPWAQPARRRSTAPLRPCSAPSTNATTTATTSRCTWPIDVGAEGSRLRPGLSPAAWRADGAPLESVDFEHATEQARVAINRWAATETHDRIREILGPGLSDGRHAAGAHERGLPEGEVSLSVREGPDGRWSLHDGGGQD